jgi:hypothetical protein
VPEVVDRVAYAQIGQPAACVNLIEQDRHQAGMPVVRVNHVRPLAGLEHELERRLAEEREALGVVREAVVRSSVEELLPAAADLLNENGGC